MDYLTQGRREHRGHGTRGAVAQTQQADRIVPPWQLDRHGGELRMAGRYAQHGRGVNEQERPLGREHAQAYRSKR